MKEMVFNDYVAAINEHDIDKICSFMAEDHKFIDSDGNEVSGKAKMRLAWIGYFRWFPDYKIEITNIFNENNTIGAFGFASGSFKKKENKEPGNYFYIPAAWKAVIENDKLKLWQVYADTKRQIDIIERNK